MENLKLPITVIGVIVLQIGGFIWWTAQQAATIKDLEATVSQLGSRMAIEETVNTKRDVLANGKSIDDIWEETDDLWDEIDGMVMSIGAINDLKQRISALETEIKYIGRDHNNMMGEGMH